MDSHTPSARKLRAEREKIEGSRSPHFAAVTGGAAFAARGGGLRGEVSMYCPSCGTEVSDQTKYCTKWGVNLRRVRGVLGKGGATVRKGDEWEPAWVEDQRAKKEARRKAWVEDQRAKKEARRTAWVEDQRAKKEARRKKTPEEKRLEEIKAGVITSSVGFGLMVFLSLLFDAIASTVDGPASNILRTLWVVGLIPFMIGLGVLFNGLFVSKRIVEVKRQQEQKDQQSPLFSAPDTSPVARLVEPSQSPISDFSVTETTTTKLREPVAAPPPR